MKKLYYLALVQLLLLFIVTGCKSSRPEIYPLPVKYPTESKPWVNEKDFYLDSVVFHDAIDVTNYSKIVALPIDQKDTAFVDTDAEYSASEKLELPNLAKENKEYIADFIGDVDSLYWNDLKKIIPSLSLPVEKADKAPAPGNYILLQTRTLIIDPGSATKRIMIGFGAGAAKLKLEFTLVDGNTGKKLLTALSEDRNIGGAWGGKSYNLLEENLEEITTTRLSVLLSSIFKK